MTNDNNPCSPASAATTTGEKPIDMLLFCPQCGEQHVDEAKPDVCETCGGEQDEFPRNEGALICTCKVFTAWLNPPHKSHRCTSCNHVWRPADVPTNGVRYTATTGSRDGNPRPRYFATAKDYEDAVAKKEERIQSLEQELKLMGVERLENGDSRITMKTYNAFFKRTGEERYAQEIATLRAQVEELEKERERLQKGLQRADDCIVAFEQATGGLQNVESMRGEFQELREYKIRYEQSRDEIAMMNRLNDSLVSQVASLTAAREQVRAEVVEKCARVADTHAQECRNNAKGSLARNYWLDRVEACEWVAARIRALLEERGDEG